MRRFVIPCLLALSVTFLGATFMGCETTGRVVGGTKKEASEMPSEFKKGYKEGEKQGL